MYRPSCITFPDRAFIIAYQTGHIRITRNRAGGIAGGHGGCQVLSHQAADIRITGNHAGGVTGTHCTIILSHEAAHIIIACSLTRGM